MTHAQGGTWGGEKGRAWGGEDGSSWSVQQSPGYRAVITTSDGRRLDLESIITTQINYEHTATSTFSIQIPYLDGIDQFRFGDVELYYADRFLFNGKVEQVPGPSTDPEATIAGRGIGRTLTEGRITYTASTTTYDEAIREVWEDHTRFGSTVLEPESPTQLDEYEETGTPMAILKDLHEKAGMRFTIQHDQPGAEVESYVPEETVRPATWTRLDYSSEVDITGYANHVVVDGAVIPAEDRRAFGEAEDTDEIEKIGERITWPVDDSTIETDADAQRAAETILADRIAQDSFSGSVEIVPELILPGYARPIEEFDQDGDVPVLRTDSVSLSESLGSASGTVEINSTEGIIERVAELQNRQPDIERQLGE